MVQSINSTHPYEVGLSRIHLLFSPLYFSNEAILVNIITVRLLQEVGANTLDQLDQEVSQKEITSIQCWAIRAAQE